MRVSTLSSGPPRAVGLGDAVGVGDIDAVVVVLEDGVGAAVPLAVGVPEGVMLDDGVADGLGDGRLTLTGSLLLEDACPFPICPSEPVPQHEAAPDESMAQL